MDRRLLKYCYTAGSQREIFQGRGSFAKLGHSDKHS